MCVCAMLCVGALWETEARQVACLSSKEPGKQHMLVTSWVLGHSVGANLWGASLCSSETLTVILFYFIFLPSLFWCWDRTQGLTHAR
jgi:hypothetical protein